MKKVFMLCLTITLLLSCKQDKLNLPRSMEGYLKHIINKYPNIGKNDLVTQKASDYFASTVDTMINDFDELPMKVFNISPSDSTKISIVQFYADNHNLKSEILSNNIEVELVGLMDEDMASKIENKGIYWVYYHKPIFINTTETLFSFVNGAYYSPGAIISKGDLSDRIVFHAGTVMCLVDSVKLIGHTRF